MTNDEIEKLLEQTAARLFEHFDAVQIMVSWNENGRTYGLNRGCGNFFARQGMAQEFITQDQAQTQANEIGRAIAPEDEAEG